MDSKPLIALQDELSASIARPERRTNAPSTLHERNWERSFISTVRPTVHTKLSRKRIFSKRLFKPEKMKTRAVRFSVDGNILKMELFENEDFTIITGFPCSSFLPHKSKWPVITAFWNFSGIVWTEHPRCVKTPFSDFSGVAWTGSRRRTCLHRIISLLKQRRASDRKTMPPYGYACQNKKVGQYMDDSSRLTIWFCTWFWTTNWRFSAFDSWSRFDTRRILI